MTVAQADGEAAPVEAGTQVHHSEHLHAVRGYRVLLPDDTNLSEAERFDQLLHNRDVRDRLVRRCGCRRDHAS